MSHPVITTDELKEKKQPTIIDVREPEEFQEGHIPGAVNIPLSKIEQEPFDTEEEIFLVCRSDRRSGLAADLLNEKGYKGVNVQGGMLEWNGPVEKEE